MTNPNMKELTEEDGKILNLVDHDFEHWSCDVFDMVLHLHLDQPVQDLLLGVQVAVETDKFGLGQRAGAALGDLVHVANRTFKL